MAEELPKAEIPEHHQEFCRALARVAREHGMESFEATYRPQFRDMWAEEIRCSWEQGRHGADADKLFIMSTLRVHTKLGPRIPQDTEVNNG